MSKIDSIDPKIAELVGVNAALVFQKIRYYCDYHKAENTNFHDGLHWSYNTHSGMVMQFPYLTKRQIRTALEKLTTGGLLLTGNYNKYKNDRTLWYAVAPNFHMTSKSNGSFPYDTEVTSTYDFKVTSTYDSEVTPLPIETNKDHKDSARERSSKKPTGGLSTLPDGFPCAEQLQIGREYLASKNATYLLSQIENIAETFALHHESKGSKFKSWPLAWKKWLLTQAQYSAARASYGKPQEQKVTTRQFLQNRGGAS